MQGDCTSTGPTRGGRGEPSAPSRQDYCVVNCLEQNQLLEWIQWMPKSVERHQQGHVGLHVVAHEVC